MYIGVYGTLRKDFGANYKMHKTEFIGETRESLNLKMISLGGFPGLIESNEKNEITFEVYKIDDNDTQTLESLDRYEGYPRFYDRKEFKFENIGLDVWIYFLHNENGEYSNYNIVESGDWTKR